ncbi:putative dehydrogenase [Crossiella equi]|uniref:Dehydrogenase n=1 Tax=Crossiella equi TaxID=130796 RepID=A0ABS5ADR2_9PSEU|nr:Gfo/Idh/MocA family oxidoreductase [Crossiella equi]MBP2474486.1 putative dehydrogenase [Crossiella equi]
MTLRAALVGYGLGGSAFHAPFLASTPGLRLAAVVTGNPERQEAVRARYPDTELVPSLEHLLARAGDFDLAVITTPNRHHYENASSALRHGLPVVVDKPFSASAEDARALADLAAARGLLAAPFHNRRFDGDFRTVRRLLGEGRMGRPTRFESRFERWRPDPTTSWKAWKESRDPADAGGITHDLGSHLIDQAVALFGRPLRVYAEIAVRRDKAVVDDDAFIALTHHEGVTSHLWMSALAADLGPRFRVLGDAGSYVKHGMDPQEALLKEGATPGGEGWGEEPESAWGRLGAVGDTSPVRTEPGAYQDYYAGIVRTLTEGAPPPVSALDGVTTAELVEAAYQSSRTGQVVEV